MSSTVDSARPDPLTYPARDLPKIKTSAAAVFALIFGLSALLCVLTLIFSPLALPLGLVGLVLGVVGMKKAGLPHVTGKAVAVTGLVMSVLSLLILGTLVGGLFAFKDNKNVVDQLNRQLDRVSKQIPTIIPTQVPTPQG